MCVCAFYMCVSLQARDRFVQVFISPNLREKQLLLGLCIPTTMYKRNVKCKQLLLANAVPVSSHLFSFASCIFNFIYLLFLLFCCLSMSHFLSFSKMLPSSTSSTARPPKTLRSCVRLVPILSRLLLPHPLLPADLFLHYLLLHTPTPWPTQAPSPVSKACLSLSPPRVKAGLPPHVCPSLSHSSPHFGGSCRGSGTVLSWRSSQRTRGDYRR